MDKNYYPQVFLEECRYVVEEKNIPKYIIDDIEISSDSDRENSDEENSDEKNSDEKILIKKILMKKILMKKNLKTTHIVKLIFKAYKNNY